MSGKPPPTPAPPRSTPVQATPPASLRGIPTTRPAARHWCREHGHRASSTDLPATAVNLLVKHAATRGITGELLTMPDHSVPQAWAQAIHEQGHPAFVYTPRSPSGRAIAAFGPEVLRPSAATSTQPLVDVLRHRTQHRVRPNLGRLRDVAGVGG